MSNLKFDDLLGVGGRRIQWERPLLFFAALFLSDVFWFVVAPSFSHSDATGYSLELFHFAPAVNWYAELLQDVVLAALTFETFYLVKHPVGAIGTLVVSYAVISRLVEIFLVSPVYAGYRGGFSESFWEPWAFIFSALWCALFLGSLLLALRWIKIPWLALFLGAIAGSVLNSFVQVLLRSFLQGLPVELGFTLRFLPFRIVSMALFALAFWGGLRLTSDKSLVQTDGDSPLPRGYYVGTLLVTYGVPFIVSVAAILLMQFKVWGSSDATGSLLSLLIASLLLIYGVVIFCLLIYRMWAAIQDGQARTTPAKAVGFMFIPFFNLYWAFQAIPGFAKDYNNYVDRYSLNNPKLPQGLFVAYVVLCFAAIIPIVGLILVLINLVIALMMVSKICDAVNALPETLPPIAAGQTVA